VRVLIADDEPALRRLIEFTLEPVADGLLLVADGETALAVATAELPDVVLLDVMMPRLDGLEVCRRLKADPATRGIRVILLTAHAQPRDREAGIEAGADDFVTKPFSPATLLETVQRVVAAGQPPASQQ